jgi:hypothetical protein
MSDQIIYDSDFIDYISNNDSYYFFIRFFMPNCNNETIKDNIWYMEFYNEYYDEQTRANPIHNDITAFYIFEYFMDDYFNDIPNNIKNYYVHM